MRGAFRDEGEEEGPGRLASYYRRLVGEQDGGPEGRKQVVAFQVGR